MARNFPVTSCQDTLHCYMCSVETQTVSKKWHEIINAADTYDIHTDTAADLGNVRQQYVLDPYIMTPSGQSPFMSRQFSENYENCLRQMFKSQRRPQKHSDRRSNVSCAGS